MERKLNTQTMKLTQGYKVATLPSRRGGEKEESRLGRTIFPFRLVRCMTNWIFSVVFIRLRQDLSGHFFNSKSLSRSFSMDYPQLFGGGRRVSTAEKLRPSKDNEEVPRLQHRSG